jgi:hypothetical protein
MTLNSAARLGYYLREKRNFVWVGTLSFGVLCSAVVLWMLGEDGGPAWWLALTGLSFLLGWIWARVMWTFFKSDFENLRVDSRQRDSKNTTDM